MKILIVDSQENRDMFEVNETEKIKKLKEMIMSKYRIHDEIKLIFDGDILEDENLISYYDIQESSPVIYLGSFKAGLYF